MVNSTASSELQVELLPRLSRNLLLRERTLGAWHWIFKLSDQLSIFQQHQQNQALAYVKFLVR